MITEGLVANSDMPLCRPVSDVSTSADAGGGDRGGRGLRGARPLDYTASRPARVRVSTARRSA